MKFAKSVRVGFGVMCEISEIEGVNFEMERAEVGKVGNGWLENGLEWVIVVIYGFCVV